MKRGIYIHIPFCEKKCSYCDFLSVGYNRKSREKYVSYLLKEIKFYNDITFESVYFGGGTPSLLEVEEVSKILKSLNIKKGAEITIEVNPNSITKEKLIGYKEAGVNRLSIGLQSFNERHLRSLNRLHTRREGIAAYYLGREVGFDNISLDLMFSLPNQSIDELKKDLLEIVTLDPEHISIYSLIYEEGTKFHKDLLDGKLEKIDEEVEATMYEIIINFLKENGYSHYEISNFSKKDREGKHNSSYWLNREYIGVGLGASGYYKGVRYKNIVDFNSYYDKIDSEKTPILESEDVSRRDRIEYYYISTLRLLNLGVKGIGRYKEICEKLTADGFLYLDNNRYKLTKKGIFLGNSVFIEFLEGGDN